MATLSAQQVYAAARGAGATHDEAVILTAIAKGESGWRTDAHNPNPPDNSYGLWQINMLGEMGANRRAQFSISSNEALFDPRVNAKAALAILRGQGWNAWSVYSNGSYRQFLGEAQAAGGAIANDWQTVARSLNQAFPAGEGSGGVGTMIGGGPTGLDSSTAGFDVSGMSGNQGLPPNATPEQIEDYIRENFPQAAGFLDIPEIRQVLIDAARGQWTDTKLQAEINATTWWRTNGVAARNYFALKGTDPAQLESLISAKLAELGPEIAQLGLNLGGPEGARQWAENAIKYGWTPDQLQEKLAAQLQKRSTREGLAEGSAVDLSADGLMRIARSDYFVPISRADAERWAIDIFAGRKTEETMRNYFARLAESRFPGLAEQGFTPGEYMAPVRNVIAETLELNPADVDLLDARWSEVLEMQGPDGRFRPMTLGEAGRWARGRNEYRVTSGAKAEAASLAETLGKTFGMVA